MWRDLFFLEQWIQSHSSICLFCCSLLTPNLTKMLPKSPNNKSNHIKPHTLPSPHLVKARRHLQSHRTTLTASTLQHKMKIKKFRQQLHLNRLGRFSVSHFEGVRFSCGQVVKLFGMQQESFSSSKARDWSHKGHSLHARFPLQKLASF